MSALSFGSSQCAKHSATGFYWQSFIKEDSIIKAYNLNTAKLEPKDREKL
ncbi:hypothetical protein [Helicobacter pylori]